MTYKEEVCIDAGSENCPCLLAESGDCITCSRLQGKDCCDCNWRGVCIYNEYIQNGKKINNRRESKKTRILKKIWSRGRSGGAGGGSKQRICLESFAARLLCVPQALP